MSLKKLQFGCGENRLEGFENYDRDLDVTVMPLPFPDGVAELIAVEHLVEHLNAPSILRLLSEIHRILAAGGVVRVCCPVVGPWLTREHARDLATGHGHEVLLTEDVMRTFLWMAGFDQCKISRTDRKEIDGHWKIIGKTKDDAETCRMEAIKT